MLAQQLLRSITFRLLNLLIIGKHEAIIFPNKQCLLLQNEKNSSPVKARSLIKFNGLAIWVGLNSLFGDLVCTVLLFYRYFQSDKTYHSWVLVLIGFTEDN